MTFDEEWARLTAAASVRTRLNQAGDSGQGPGGQKTLDVTPSLLKDRAGKAEGVRGQFTKADDGVVRQTEQVQGSLKGFGTDKAVTTFLERWRDQMSYAKGLFTDTARALRSAADSFEGEDTARARSFRSGISDFADTSEGKR